MCPYAVILWNSYGKKLIKQIIISGFTSHLFYIRYEFIYFKDEHMSNLDIFTNDFHLK